MAKQTAYRKAYYLKNKERYATKYRTYQEVHANEQLKLRREYRRKRKGTDILYKLKANIRSRTSMALRGKSWDKTSCFSEYIGCTPDILKDHIEKQFQSGMNWNNYGDWEIDHIIPLVSAKTVTELYKLCHYTNLQPLWARDNRKKSDHF